MSVIYLAASVIFYLQGMVLSLAEHRDPRGICIPTGIR